LPGSPAVYGGEDVTPSKKSLVFAMVAVATLALVVRR